MKKLLIGLITLGFSSVVLAAGYGTAGCGLGSMVFGNKKGPVQVLAATTNGTFGSQTFGITSGTSNCAAGGKTPTQFIEVNKAALSNDIARGQGQTVSALSEIYGCDNVQTFQETLKENFSTIFSSNQADTINTNIRNVISLNNLACNV